MKLDPTWITWGQNMVRMGNHNALFHWPQRGLAYRLDKENKCLWRVYMAPDHDRRYKAIDETLFAYIGYPVRTAPVQMTLEEIKEAIDKVADADPGKVYIDVASLIRGALEDEIRRQREEEQHD
jgi:hypothetical protein